MSPHFEYMFGAEGKNETFSHSVRFRSRLFASTVQLFWKGFRRRETNHGMENMSLTSITWVGELSKA